MRPEFSEYFTPLSRREHQRDELGIWSWFDVKICEILKFLSNFYSILNLYKDFNFFLSTFLTKFF